MKRLNMWLVLGAVVVAAGLLTAVSAEASKVSVKQAVLSQKRVVDPQLNKMIRAANNPNGKPAKLEGVLRVLQGKLLHAAHVVGAAYAANSRIATGQRNWVAAAHQLVRGLGQLIGALRAAQHNQASLAKRDARNATRTINAAEARGNEAEREIGIS